MLLCLLFFLGYNGVNEFYFYGSIFMFGYYGLVGCLGSQNGGKGGGFIIMEVGDEFYFDGIIVNDGQDVVSGLVGGGGSGGSIWIKCGRFNGYGFIILNGGVGDGFIFGGGFGGWIVVDILMENKYVGEYIVIGGDLGDLLKDIIQYFGGLGIVFLKDV